MFISTLIAQLQHAQKQHGDLPLSTFDGMVSTVKITPCKDGISYPLKEGDKINEINLEILSLR